MKVFTDISADEWNTAASIHAGASVFLDSAWEAAVRDALPFVNYRHYRYRDTHLLRIADISGRLTTAPFAEGSDVIALSDAPLDLHALQDDLQAQFEMLPRLRINTRFATLSTMPEEQVVAHEYVVDLGAPLLPRLRKTLRHTLSRTIEGSIERTRDAGDVDAAYLLYLRHMRSVRNFAMPITLFASLISEGGGELWVWRLDGTVHAMAIFLPSDAEVLYSLSAADASALTQNAAQHIVYTALETYREEGRARASLGATGVGSPLEVFKRGWRGESYRVIELGARSFGLGRSSRVRELVGYVPLSLYPFLTSTVGRYLL